MGKGLFCFFMVTMKWIILKIQPVHTLASDFIVLRRITQITMKKQDTTTGLLTTLLKTNMDRIKGYEMAAQETSEFQAELRSVFYKMADESRRYITALEAAIVSQGGAPKLESTAGGDIYRVWMKLKTSFNGDGAAAALNSCEFGENVALHVYRKVFMKFNGNRAIQELIQNQYDSLKASRSLIQRYRMDYFSTSRLSLPVLG